MVKLLVAVTLAFLTFMATLVFSTEHYQPINEFYVFGDSLSDTGTVFRATAGMYPPDPPYFKGRYSNGPVWVEYLSDRLQLTAQQVHNFACGGAMVTDDRSSLAPGLLTQVQSFTKTRSQLNSDALYVLWAGANDYLQGVSNAMLPVEQMTKAIATLAQIGAKRVLVANLPDLGKLPATRNTTNAAVLNALTQTHNQDLRRSLKQLNQQYHDLQLIMMDANALYRKATTQPAAFHFTNVTDACLEGVRPCSNPNQFLFWDSIHPTTAAHRYLSETAFSAIQEAGLGQQRSALLP